MGEELSILADDSDVDFDDGDFVNGGEHTWLLIDVVLITIKVLSRSVATESRRKNAEERSIDGRTARLSVKAVEPHAERKSV